MKLILALAVSALAAKPTPVKVVPAGLGKTTVNVNANLGVPFLSPALKSGSLQNLKLAPNPLGLNAQLNDFNAPAGNLGEAKLGEAKLGDGGNGEAKVTAMEQAETAALPEMSAAQIFDGYENGETLMAPKKSLFSFGKTEAKAQPVMAEKPFGMTGLKRSGGKWGKGGQRLQRLGSGTVGFVDVHPSKPGLILKTIEPSFDQMFVGLTMDVAIKADEEAAAALAKAGVGPKVIGSAVVQGRHVSVRERIYGKTVQQLSNEKKFGEAEEQLVHAMLRRMAAANTLVTDLKPENIMIGYSEKEPEVKAWFIDGGMIEELAPELDLEGRYQRILNFPNVVAVRQDMNSGQMIESYRTLESYLQDERDRRNMKPWRYFFKSLLNAYLRGGAGMGLPK